jgi:hypothetical protein
LNEHEWTQKSKGDLLLLLLAPGICIHLWPICRPPFKKLGPNVLVFFRLNLGEMMDICLNPSLFRQIMPILLDEEWGEAFGANFQGHSRPGGKIKKGIFVFFVL